MSVKLRELIRTVRAAKTGAEERAVISKESALIRTAMASQKPTEHRARNMAKLLYIHMLGYPAHFGQLECMKLCSSASFLDKRIGYLGLMLLLDERHEVLMLVTNSLKQDMASSNPYVIGLALTALGNISSVDMARDLSTDLEKLLSSSNPYVRKKAALCTIRLFRKVPELMEHFTANVRSLLTDRNHGVLLSAATLITEMCLIHPSNATEFRSLAPSLIRILKNLVKSGYAPEHDIGGITDPFLQVKLLRLLRLLGRNDDATSEALNDILAQVATNTDTSKNVGNAVLYEAVNTILAINAEPSLRVMAVNILGRFLTNRDNNIRYVALNTLSRVVGSDPTAVSRHRSIIIDCLKDKDISIRRRALDVTHGLVNEDNVRPLVKELLSRLVDSDSEFRQDLTSKLCVIVDRFSPDTHWYIDTLLKVIEHAGNYVRDDVARSMIAVIGQHPDLQAYAVHRLHAALAARPTENVLAQAASWCIGEFGELLVAGAEASGDAPALPPVSPDTVVTTLEDALSKTDSLLTKEAILTTYVKLTTRLSNDNLPRLLKNIAAFNSSANVELQQRAVEYTALVSLESLRDALLERMPPIDETRRRRMTNATAPSNQGEDDKPADPSSPAGGDALAAPTPAAPAAPAPAVDLLGDLMDLNLGGSAAPAATPAAPAPGGTGLDLLGDLMGGGAPVATPAAAPAASGGAVDLLGDLMGGGSMAAAAPMSAGSGMAGAPASIPSVVAYNKSGLQITFSFTKPDPSNSHITEVTGEFANTTGAPMEKFVFQAAVPKFMTVTLAPASGTVIPAGGKMQQKMTLNNTAVGQKPVVMRVKLDYATPAGPVAVQDTINNFPAGI